MTQDQADESSTLTRGLAIKACGAWPNRGGCRLPVGHNIGMADVPENHMFKYVQSNAANDGSNDAILILKEYYTGELRLDLEQLAVLTKAVMSRCEAAEGRILLAQQALVGTGYFSKDEVGDDVAPRIVELWAHVNGLHRVLKRRMKQLLREVKP